MSRTMFTADEQAWLRGLIDNNDAEEWVKNGAVDGIWGAQWRVMLMFRRGSTGVSFRDTNHNIMEPIAVCQSLPYRLFNYVDEGNIPFGVPRFPGHEADIPFYFDKFAAGIGSYADLYFLDSSGRIHTADGASSDNGFVAQYATKHNISVQQVFMQAQQMVLMYQGRGVDRALSRKEIFP